VSREELGWDGQQIELQTPLGMHHLTLPLAGEHQAANLALATLAAEALAALGLDRFDRAAIAAGVAMTRWPGRLEWVEPPATKPVLLDVAHNPDGAETLRRSLDGVEGRCVLLFGALADKEVHRVQPVLAERADKVVLTSPASPRAMDLEALAAMVRADKTVIETDRTAALSAALEAAGDFVVVCGSVYLVGDVRLDLRRRFGVPYPATDNLQRL
jgi:dihydrofolate synthase/folylpolyglutamate synthase